MGLISPDRTTESGIRSDKFWPGRVHTDWKMRFLRLTRERIYRDPDRINLKTMAYQLVLSLRKRRIGIRYEKSR